MRRCRPDRRFLQCGHDGIFGLHPATDVLLAQQLIGSFVQTPQGTAKAPSQPYALKQLVESKIIGPKGRAGGIAHRIARDDDPDEHRLRADDNPLYPQSGQRDPTARTAVLNGVSIIKNGAFGIQKVKHY